MSQSVQQRPSMHRSAHASTPVVTGNTARALQHSALSSPGIEPGRERRRTPLSVVPAAPTRGRVPVAVFSMVALIAALVVVLMLNISVSSSQYKLVSMRGQEVALAEQNQALMQQLENLRAPQNLATAAHKLDMVASPTFGTIDIDSLAVSGSPEPATGSDAPAVLVPPPAVAKPSEAAAPAAPVEQEAPAAEPSADAPEQPAPVESTDGGTIPAPAQAAPGQ
jgi:acyl-CoA synthetase (AMP-forming)/AMP-acid ligase II